ncbi:hypothetical protein ACFL12_01090 [Pseudomonadota bacterium]
MGERVSIAKAAKLLGLDRHELCERLCHAGVESFEGSVELDEVKRISPKLALDENLMGEKVRLIRQTARRRQAVQPPRKPELELQDDLDRMHNKWLAERKRAQEYYALFDHMIEELGHWQNADDPHRAAFAVEFSEWICRQFDSH